MTSDIPVKVRTGHLTNASLDHHCYMLRHVNHHYVYACGNFVFRVLSRSILRISGIAFYATGDTTQ